MIDSRGVSPGNQWHSTELGTEGMLDTWSDLEKESVLFNDVHGGIQSLLNERLYPIRLCNSVTSTA